MVKKQASRNSKKSELLRIAEYLVSGGAYFWSGYIVFFICDQLIGLNLFWAKLLANIIGWTVNYLLQRYWVFNNKQLSKYKTKVTGRYIFITLVNFGLDYLIVNFLKNNGLTPYIGQFVASGLFTVWNYFWYKLWVFPENTSKLKKKKRKK